MLIDAREIELPELFLQLRVILASLLGENVTIEIFLRNYSDAKKVTAFAAMSGCQTSIEKKGDYCIVRITGHVCCV